MIEVRSERENYQEVMEIVVDEEGCEGLKEFFDGLPESAKVVRTVSINVTEGSRPLRIRFESKRNHEERLRKEAEEEARREAERAARRVVEQETQRQRQAVGGAVLSEEENA